MQPERPREPRREMIGWDEVDRLIDHLIPQFRREFTAMVMITRGGVIPGGLLAEAMDITHILTAAVDFPAQSASQKAKLIAWPQFIQFPADDKLRGRPTLIVDDVWGSGRTITAVKNRVSAAGGFPETCVMHFNPYRNLFGRTLGIHGYDPARSPEMRAIFLALGRGVPAGARTGPVAALDVAPTVSRLLGIEPPRSCEGKPIEPIGAGR